MAKTREPVNPFYVVLVIIGVVFLVTACAYGVMAYRAISPLAARDVERHPLTSLLDTHGVKILSGELALLAVASFAAMGLDRLRDSRRVADPAPSKVAENGHGPPPRIE
ncbi:MAG: hypothetical protein AB7O59_03030 [Pirellulales bacterium]